jgi:hypothetical protein
MMEVLGGHVGVVAAQASRPSSACLSVRRTKQCTDVFVTDFHMEAPFVHDLTVELFANGVVYEGGDGTDVNFDGHRACPWGNVWSNINVGAGKESARKSRRGCHMCGSPSCSKNYRASMPIFKMEGELWSPVDKWVQASVECDRVTMALVRARWRR